MKNIILRKKVLLSVLILSLIGAAVYHVWISFSAFAYGDWAFAFSNTLKEYLYPSAWGIHGGPLLWSYPLYAVYGILGNLTLGFNVVEKLMVFWPIMFVAPLSCFFLIRKILNSAIGGFVGSLIFSYCTYFLSIDTQGHELLTVAFAFVPLVLLAVINLLENKKRIFIPITVSLLFVIGSYDFRSLYIAVGIIFLYFIYNQLFLERDYRKNLRKNVEAFFAIFFFFGLLNAYWLLPVISLNELTNNAILSRQLFGSEFYNIQNSLTFFYPFWTGKVPTWLYLQKIPFLFWLYPILAFSGLIVNKKNKQVIFFALLAVIGIFLTKQDGPPFGFLYNLFYSYLPGFNAFREASKFDFIITISYSVLIAAFVDFLWKYLKRKKVRYLVIFLIILLPLWNTVPLLTGEIKTLFIPKQVPHDYINLKNLVISHSEYSKVLGINLNQYYNFTTINHPTSNAADFLSGFWGNNAFLGNNLTVGEKIVKYLDSDEGRRLLSDSSVGYIPVFITDEATNQNIWRDLGNKRQYFEDEIGKIKYLKRIDAGLQNILLYEDKDSKPHLYLTNEKESLRKDVAYKKVDFEMINQSEYRIEFKNLTGPVYLNFTELYDSAWEINVGEFKWYDVLFKKGYFLPNSIHFQNAVKYNSFLIDPRVVCNTSTAMTCKINKDGTKNFEATLYFRPQSYLYLGIIISGTTFIAIFLGLLFALRKDKIKK